MDIDIQRSSSSSSSCNVQLEMNHQEPSISDKIEGGQENKKLKAVSQSQPESENQNELENKCLIDELPPEMLMEILKRLNVKSLVNSRLVSRKWNGMAREIIQSRDDVETVFNCMKIEYGTSKIFGRTTRASFSNFIKYFKDSEVSPLYTRFRFDYFGPSIFDHADWIKFVSDFGPSVKSLRLVSNRNFNDGVLMGKLAEKLRDLLLIQLPNLGEFGLQYLDLEWLDILRPRTRTFRNIKLFLPTTATIQLPSLKVLNLDKNWFIKYPGIVMDLVGAAVNLEKVEPFGKNNLFRRAKIFKLLQSFGKLHCLETAKIQIDAHFMSRITGESSAPLEFKLKKLHLTVSPNFYKTEALWSDASKFLCNLFESTKDTLKEIKMNPIGFLPDLQFPKFSKLIRLTIIIRDVDQKIQVLPFGLDFSDTFPLLQYLESDELWTNIFPHDENPNPNDSCLQNLMTLKITGDGMKKEDVARISQVCPNLKELEIGCNHSERLIKNFPEVGEVIWTHLKQLESLSLKVDLSSPANDFRAVNSCFTGFSGKDVIRLHNLRIKSGQSAKKQGSQNKLESKNQLVAERKNPSILDLKDLRKLEMHYFGRRFEKFVRAPQLMSVSEECAFKLMENLTYEFK